MVIKSEQIRFKVNNPVCHTNKALQSLSYLELCRQPPEG